MAILNRDAILQANDLKSEIVSVPEWGGEVYIRCMTGTERDAFESATIDMRGKNDVHINLENARARLLSMTICDENGKRMFSDADLLELGAKNSIVLDRLFGIAQRLSGLTKKDIRDLVKN